MPCGPACGGEGSDAAGNVAATSIKGAPRDDDIGTRRRGHRRRQESRRDQAAKAADLPEPVSGFGRVLRAQCTRHSKIAAAFEELSEQSIVYQQTLGRGTLPRQRRSKRVAVSPLFLSAVLSLLLCWIPPSSGNLPDEGFGGSDKHPQCNCAHGTATIATGSGPTRCSVDGQHDCWSCDEGYHLSVDAAANTASTCDANECICAHGAQSVATGSGGFLCAADSQHDCSSCDEGYHLSVVAAANTASTCDANACNCAHGTATIATGSGPTRCSVDGQHDCWSCDEGYHLSVDAAANTASACDANECICAHGEQSVATGPGPRLCSVDGQHDCWSCDAGYHLSVDAAANTASTCDMNEFSLFHASNRAELDVKIDECLDENENGDCTDLANVNGVIGAWSIGSVTGMSSCE